MENQLSALMIDTNISLSVNIIFLTLTKRI